MSCKYEQGCEIIILEVSNPGTSENVSELQSATCQQSVEWGRRQTTIMAAEFPQNSMYFLSV